MVRIRFLELVSSITAPVRGVRGTKISSLDFLRIVATPQTKLHCRRDIMTVLGEDQRGVVAIPSKISHLFDLVPRLCLGTSGEAVRILA